jgi:DNA processing protein
LDDPRADRRLRWVGWSLRPEIRPSVLADLIRLRDGDPPPIPMGPNACPLGFRLRASDRALFSAPSPTGDDARATLAAADALGVRILTPDDDEWMRRFWSELTDPPAALYVRGELHGVDHAAVAIVGSRYPSPNGMALARSLARDIAGEGVTIVSGLALGIDGAAHRGALDIEGRTVAVLGGGVDCPSPPSHAALGERVARAGAVVSEFPLRSHPRPLHFPRRNRILAALAQVVLVVEGCERSGARSTVDHAASLGRDIAAVPRDPVHEGSELPNALLRSGATPVARAQDVLDLLASSSPSARRVPVGRSEDDLALEESVLGGLAAGRCGVDRLSRSVGRDPSDLLGVLGRLEALGRVRRLPGMQFEIKGRRT